MTKDKKIIISISSCICLIDVFYELFFNIYIMQTVTTDLALIFGCYLAGIAISLLLYYPFFKILNGKTAIWIYRSSFLLSFIVVLLSMTLNSNFVFTLIFITFIRQVFGLCFYVPQEIAVMKHVDKNDSGKFLAIKVMVNTTFKVLFSLLVSSLFTFFNTFWLFVIMLVDVAVMFVLSFWASPAGVDFNFRPKGFLNDIKKYPHMKYIYVSHTFKRASEAGVVATIIPLILYINTGSEFSLGIYASIACILTACWLPLFARFKKHKSQITLISIITLILSSLLLIINVSPLTYALYYLINQFASSSYTNIQNASLFDSIKYPVLFTNKEEHAYFYSLFGKIAEIFSYSIGIIFYLIMPIKHSLACTLIFFMITKLVSYFFWQKSESYSKKLTKLEIIQI